MLILQVNSINGNIINQARWEVNEFTNISVSQSMRINLPTDDMNLLAYVTKQAKNECSIEKSDDKYSIMVKCLVKEVQHMFDPATNEFDSLATLIPINRYAECTIVYILDPKKCDPRFVQLINQSVEFKQ